MRRYIVRALVPSFLVVGVACGSSESEIAPSSPDGGTNAGSDSGTIADSSIPDPGRPDTGVDAGPLCNVNNGGCHADAICNAASGSVVCTCKPGYSGDGGSCSDVDECATNNGGCGANATCTNTPGGRTCTCNGGFSGDGGACGDIDECAVNNGGCGANATCTNNPGGRTCTCNGGYSGDGGVCDDIDECATNNGGCDPNATCANTVGSRTCTCKPGFDGTGLACALTTTTIAADTNLSTTNTGTRTCADGGDMVSYSVIAVTGTTAQLSTAASADCLSPGDEVLLINLQGTAVSTINTGNYEVLSVSAVAGDMVTFGAKTKYFGEGAADDANIGTGAGQQRVMLQRVPRYGNLVVDAAMTLTADAWNGMKGGVLAFTAAGAVTVNGTISMTGKGYAGGLANTVVNTTGAQGESIDGPGTAATQSSSTGRGGGGRGDNTGCFTYGVGGGGGGYGTAGAAAEVGDACGGAGGGVYGDAQLMQLLLGSGGGAGGTDNVLFDNPRGGLGGSGGGIVFIKALGGVTGSLASAGTEGEGDAVGVDCSSAQTDMCWDYSGPGGGGAGGSILVSAASFTGTTSVAGGVGGNGWSGAESDGGQGGSGRASTP
jgi:hypothetical protein